MSKNKYIKSYFKASDINRSDLAYKLVFMNTCSSTDQYYVPIELGDTVLGFHDFIATPNTHAVLDIGKKLHAVSYVGWDCSVSREVAPYVPTMLMEELDWQKYVQQLIMKNIQLKPQ